MTTQKTVVKRNGDTDILSAAKIRARLERLMHGLSDKHIDLNLVIDKTVNYTQNGK
jgi:hypothetical protein